MSDRIFRVLESAIVTGEIALGSKLGEAALASRYGISRGPLREALRRLEGRHLVERVPHSGTRVVTLTREGAIHVYFVREALEGMACRLAAQSMPHHEIGDLDRILERHGSSEVLRAGEAYHQERGDLDFHYRVVIGSMNDRLIQLLCGDLYSLIRLCRYRTNAFPGRSLRAFEEHVQIVKAIRGRDPDLAEMLMRRHIAGARKILENAADVDFAEASEPRRIDIPSA
ncbi:MAG: GntR family transcriptional regulator [Kiloniellaceae bacterium]